MLDGGVMFGFAADDVRMSATALHRLYDGNNWSDDPGVPLGDGQGAGHAVDGRKWLLRETQLYYSDGGIDWYPMQLPNLNGPGAIWGSGPDDVWTADWGQERLVHWDGNDWSPVNVNDLQDVEAIWGAAPDDVWAVGGPDLIHHCNGLGLPSGGAGGSAAAEDAREWAAGSHCLDLWCPRGSAVEPILRFACRRGPVSRRRPWVRPEEGSRSADTIRSSPGP